MKFLEALRKLWSRAPAPDHPLDERERDEDRPLSGLFDAKARVEGFEVDGDDDGSA